MKLLITLMVVMFLFGCIHSKTEVEIEVDKMISVLKAAPIEMWECVNMTEVCCIYYAQDKKICILEYGMYLGLCVTGVIRYLPLTNEQKVGVAELYRMIKENKRRNR